MSAFPQSWTSTTSHWQATNRGPDSLFGHGKDDALPSEVDILLIGAGITGAALSYHLTRSGAAGTGKRVVLLEAKDLASGATGRNGGHCGPASFSAFPSLVNPLAQGGAGIDAESALHVLENEYDTLNLVEEVIKKEGLDVDFWRGQKLEVRVTPGGVDEARKAEEMVVAALKDSKRYNVEGGRLPWEWEFIDDVDQAKKISRIPTALSVSRGGAGSVHPHKLATALVKLAISSKSSDFSFHSWCPVSTIIPHADEEGYEVDCHGRGMIRAKKVVLCTNAHTKHLFPESEWSSGLSAHITPFRGHAGNVTTTLPYSGAKSLVNTYGIEDGPYLISTTKAGIVLGPTNGTVMGTRLAGKEDMFGQVDDSIVKPEFVDWLSRYCKENFEGWGKESIGEGLMRTWTGIMAASHDYLPLVGEVPGKSGLYACVAFHGHGMARILTAARGVAHTLNTDEWDQRLPEVFKITQERLDRVRNEAPAIVMPKNTGQGWFGGLWGKKQVQADFDFTRGL